MLRKGLEDTPAGVPADALSVPRLDVLEYGADHIFEALH